MIQIGLIRRPPGVGGTPATMDLGPEPPAIAALLCDGYDPEFSNRDQITGERLQRKIRACQCISDFNHSRLRINCRQWFGAITDLWQHTTMGLHLSAKKL